MDTKFQILVEEDRSFKPDRPKSLSTADAVSYDVVIVRNREKTVVMSFDAPGNISTGFLSKTQAKGRAREMADRLRKTILGEIAPERYAAE